MPHHTNNQQERVVSPENIDSDSHQQDLSVARPLHPEDLAIGDNVAILHTSSQFPTFNWCGFDTTMLPIEQPVKITYLPYDDYEALQVKKICLPFVICKTFEGRHRYLDIRQVQLARLDEGYANADRKARKHDQQATNAEHLQRSKKKKRDKKKKKKSRRN